MFGNKIDIVRYNFNIEKRKINSASSQNIVTPLRCFDTKVKLTRPKNVTVGNKYTAKVARRVSATYKHEKMSDEAEMTIEAEIIILHKSDAIDLEERKDLDLLNIKYDEFLKTITAISNIRIEISNIVIIKPITTIIMEKLLSTCANNEADVIFIIGDIEFNERHYVNEVIEFISNELSKNLANLITNIKTKLKEITGYISICGIRNKTLIIGLPSPHENNCIAAIADTLQSTLRLIHANENVSLFDTACFSDNNSPEQRKDMNADKNVEKAFSSLDSSCTESINETDINNHYMESFPMISARNAIMILNEIAIANINKNNSESIKINDAYGRILYEDVHSNCNVPPFKTSKKHGYAVLVSDGKGLRQVLKEKNKFPPISLQRGTCVWVNSGEALSADATAVVEAKDVKRIESSPNNDKVYIEIMVKPLYGQNINPIGYDIMKEKIIINKHTRIGPEEMGLLAASGCKNVIVTQQLSIGVLSIGNNLEEPGKPLKPGYVYDINRITLISLLKHNDFSALDFGIVNNEVSCIQMNIKEALKKVNILVTTGSVNDKDLLKRILIQYFEAKIYFGNVNMKPGKSTTLGSCKINNKTKYFLCLSGNPVSAFIAAQIFLLPFVKRMCCYANSEPTVIPVCVDRSYILHHRPRLAWTYLQWSDKENFATAVSMGNFFRDKLYNMVGSNALLLLPESKERWKPLSKLEMVIPGLLVDYPRNRRLLPKRSNETERNQ